MQLRPYRSPALWWSRAVPPYPVRIDRNDPAAAGLVACYVPGCTAGMVDLTGNGPPLNADNGGYMGLALEGPAYVSEVIVASAYTSGFPDAWQIGTSGTLFWRGILYTIPNSGAVVDLLIWGGITDSVSLSPTYCYGLTFDPTTATLKFSYSNSVTSNEVVSTIHSYNLVYQSVSLAASFTVGGAIALYAFSNAGATTTPIRPLVTRTTGTWSGSAPGYAQSPIMCLGVAPAVSQTDVVYTRTTSAYLFDRVLTEAQLVQLNADPFSFLEPVAPLLRNAPAPEVTGYRRWNRTYLIR